MSSFLVETGKRFERKQVAKAKTGEGRTYIALLAHEGLAVKTCMDDMFHAFCGDISDAVEPADISASLRLMRFRMLSSSLCAMHTLLRLPRTMLPYSLFALLSPGSNPNQVAQMLLDIPTCMQDELFKMLLERYPSERDLSSKEALIVVESLAKQFAVDIAAIEARHSTNRDFSLLRSKGWVPSLESVSARFNIQHFGHFGKSKTMTKEAPHVRKRRGGGGSLRAYISQRSRGQTGKVNFRALAKEFRELPEDQKQHFKEVGSLGTLAHRKGFAAFGKVRRKRVDKVLSQFKLYRALAIQNIESDSILALPGQMTSTGAIVAPDPDQSLVQSFEHHMQQQQQQKHILSIRESFAEKYMEFLDSLDEHDVLTDVLALSKEEEQSLQSLDEETSLDLTVKALHEQGHEHVANGMRLTQTSSGRATFLHWQPPAAHAAQAHLEFKCRHTHIHTYTHTYIHTYKHTYKHTNLQTYKPTYLHTYIPTYLHAYVHTNIHTNIQTYKPTNLQTYKPTYLHTYIPTCIRTYVHTYICTYVQTHKHTNIQTYKPTYLHTYIPTYLHTYIPTYLHTYMHTYIQTYIQTYKPTNLQTYKPTYLHTYIHAYTHTE